MSVQSSLLSLLYLGVNLKLRSRLHSDNIIIEEYFGANFSNELNVYFSSWMFTFII